jgi:hypothetical protein
VGERWDKTSFSINISHVKNFTSKKNDGLKIAGKLFLGFFLISLHGQFFINGIIY